MAVFKFIGGGHGLRLSMCVHPGSEAGGDLRISLRQKSGKFGSGEAFLSQDGSGDFRRPRDDVLIGKNEGEGERERDKEHKVVMLGSDKGTLAH